MVCQNVVSGGKEIQTIHFLLLLFDDMGIFDDGIGEIFTLAGEVIF